MAAWLPGRPLLLLLLKYDFSIFFIFIGGLSSGPKWPEAPAGHTSPKKEKKNPKKKKEKKRKKERKAARKREREREKKFPPRNGNESSKPNKNPIRLDFN